MTGPDFSVLLSGQSGQWAGQTELAIRLGEIGIADLLFDALRPKDARLAAHGHGDKAKIALVVRNQKQD